MYWVWHFLIGCLVCIACVYTVSPFSGPFEYIALLFYHQKKKKKKKKENPYILNFAGKAGS